MRLLEIKQYRDWPFADDGSRDMNALFEAEISEEEQERLVRKYLADHPEATIKTISHDVFKFVMEHLDPAECPNMHRIMERAKPTKAGQGYRADDGSLESIRENIRRLNGGV